MNQINFDEIKIGDTIISDVFKRPAKVIEKTDTRAYFYGRHPMDSSLTYLYWYEKKDDGIYFKVAANVFPNDRNVIISELKEMIKTSPEPFWFHPKNIIVKTIYLIKRGKSHENHFK